MHRAGSFDSERCAAQAYDQCLRALCQDRVRLRRSLNFPTAAEGDFQEDPATARARGIATVRDSFGKEEESFRRLQERFLHSSLASSYEIVPVPGMSRVDALFQQRGSSTGGLRLQLKSASSNLSGTRGRQKYGFMHTSGYEGMLLVLIALDIDSLWVVPGTAVRQKCLRIAVGSSRDHAWHAPDIGLTLLTHFENTQELPHASLEAAELQCSTTHKVETLAHFQLKALLAGVGFHLQRMTQTAIAFDSVLSGVGSSWRVQEKASNLRAKTAGYSVNLWRHAGKPGRVAYEEADFDMLLAAVLNNGMLLGMFLLPSHVLMGHRLLGQKPASLRLCPPWAPGKRQATREKYAWQLDHFVDLRRPPEQVDADVLSRLLQVLRAGEAQKRCLPEHLA